MNRFTRTEKLQFTAACLGMLLFGVVMISLGSLIPMVAEKFDLNEIEAGTVLSLLPFGILLGSMIFGPLVDLIGYKKILLAGALFSFFGFHGIGWSSSNGWLQISILLIGFGGGILNGATNALVSDISTDRQSANLSILGVFFGVGALSVPALVGLLKVYLSLEQITLWIGMSLLIPILFFLTVKFPKPKNAQGFPISKGLELIKDPVLLSLAFVLFFQSALEGLTNNWTTTYLQNEKSFSPENALFSLSLFVAGLTLTRLILGKVLQKHNPYKVLIYSLICLLISILVFWHSTNSILSLTGLIGIGVGLASGFPVVLSYVGRLYSDLSGTAFSLVITIALIGNVTCNYLMGLISQFYGISSFPMFLTLLLLIMSALILTIRKKQIFNT